MGLLDIFQKGKQTLTEVQEEIDNWRSIDSEVLRAIAEEDLFLAKNLYIQKTGASRVRAALVVERIAKTVLRDYDPSLKDDVMEAIADVWPYGDSSIIAFRPDSAGKTVHIGKVWMDTDLEGNYIFHSDFFRHENESYRAIIKDGVIYLNDNGNVFEIEDLKLGDINFNTQNSEYIRYKKTLDRFVSESSYETFEQKDLEKVKNGEMSERALMAAATRYKFTFSKDHDVCWNEMRLDCSDHRYNIAEIFNRMFFMYFKGDLNTEQEDPDHFQKCPWKIESMFDAFDFAIKKDPKKTVELMDLVLSDKFPDLNERERIICIKKIYSLWEFFKPYMEKSYLNGRITEMYIAKNVDLNRPIAVLEFHPVADNTNLKKDVQDALEQAWSDTAIAIQLFKGNTRKIVILNHNANVCGLFSPVTK